MSARAARRLAGLVAAAALVLHVAHFKVTWADDAFITFRYARNLAEGRGMVFNEGEAVEGLTNLLWAVVLAPFTDGDVLWAAQVLGLASAVGALALLVAWAEREDIGVMGTSAMLAALVAAPWLPFWSWQGLETGPVTFMVTLGWSRYHAEVRDARRWPLAGLGMGLAPALRPDAAMLAGVVGLHHLLQREGPRWGRPALRAALVTAALALALVLAKLAWFGAVLPNTLTAKTVGAHPLWGWQYLSTWLSRPSPFFPALASLAALAALARPRRPAALPAMVVVAWWAASVAVGGDLMSNFRLLVPAWPALAACVGVGVHALAAWRGAGAAALVLTLASLAPLAGVHHAFLLREPRAFPRSSAELHGKPAPLLQPGAHPSAQRGLRDYYSFAVAWLLVHAPDDATLSFSELGLFSWVLRQPVLDPLGLTDPVMARRDAANREEIWSYFSGRVDLVAADTDMGWWEGNQGYLARDGWRAVAGCEKTWILAHPEAPAPRPQAPEILERRLAELLRTTPRMGALHLSVARELLNAGVPREVTRGWFDEVAALAAPGLAEDVRVLACELEGRCAVARDRCELVGARTPPEQLADPSRWPVLEGPTLSGAPRESLGPGGDVPLGRPEDAAGPPLPPGQAIAPADGALGPPDGARGPPDGARNDRDQAPPRRASPRRAPGGP